RGALQGCGLLRFVGCCFGEFALQLLVLDGCFGEFALQLLAQQGAFGSRLGEYAVLFLYLLDPFEIELALCFQPLQLSVLVATLVRGCRGAVPFLAPAAARVRARRCPLPFLAPLAAARVQAAARAQVYRSALRFRGLS